MVMPCSQNEIAVLYNYLQNIRKFTRIEAITVGYQNLRFKPAAERNPPSTSESGGLRWR